MTTSARCGLFLCALFSAASGCTDRPLALPRSDDGFQPSTDLAGMKGPFDLSRDADPPGPTYCERILVLSDTGALAFFDPASLGFQPLTQLDCPAMGGAGAYSIALDHQGTAWVEYVSGELFTVDLTTGACSPTSFVVGQKDFHNFSMSFSADPQGGTEALYISAKTGPVTAKLGKIDVASLVVSDVGSLPSAGELTSTESGELWAMFRGTAPHAGRIDKLTGTVAPDFHLGSALGNISSAGVAFSALHGSLYLFLLRQNSSTSVYRLSPSDGALDKILGGSGQRVISASAATCP